MHVLVISSHHLLGQSLVSLLQSQPADNPITATLCDASVVSPPAQTSPASVILMEAVVDFAGALASVQAVASVAPDAGIVVLGPAQDRSLAYAAIRAGAAGYVAADVAAATLSRTLWDVMHGRLGLPGDVAPYVVRKLRQAILVMANSETQAAHYPLTPQQHEILCSIQQGHRTGTIANRLGATEADVVKQFQRLAATLQTRNAQTM